MHRRVRLTSSLWAEMLVHLSTCSLRWMVSDPRERTGVGYMKTS